MSFNEQTIDQFEQGLLRRGYGEKTRQSYKYLVSKFLGFVDERCPDWKPFTNSATDKTVVETYNTYLREEELKKTASTNAALCAVARFFSFHGYSRRFKLQQAPAPSRPDRLSDIQLEHLRRLLPARSVKHQCIVMLFLATGLRPQELSALQIADVQLENNRIHVRQAESERFIPLEFETSQMLQSWLLERAKIAPLSTVLFVNPNGQAISCTGLDFIVKSVGQKAQIYLSARILRNTYIKHLLNDGTELLDVVHLAGLKNVASIWRHVSP